MTNYIKLLFLFTFFCTNIAYAKKKLNLYIGSEYSLMNNISNSYLSPTKYISDYKSHTFNLFLNKQIISRRNISLNINIDGFYFITKTFGKNLIPILPNDPHPLKWRNDFFVNSLSVNLIHNFKNANNWKLYYDIQFGKAFIFNMQHQFEYTKATSIDTLNTSNISFKNYSSNSVLKNQSSNFVSGGFMVQNVKYMKNYLFSFSVKHLFKNLIIRETNSEISDVTNGIYNTYNDVIYKKYLIYKIGFRYHF
jgi:hypothetical protein